MKPISFNAASGPVHIIWQAPVAPGLAARWDDVPWSDCVPLEIQHFHRQSSVHHPRTAMKLCYDLEALYVLFRVEDRFVVSRNMEPGSAVYEDSCVEAFIEPGPETGYINVETNAGGAVLASHITDRPVIPGTDRGERSGNA